MRAFRDLDLSDSRILIVDDREDSIRLLETILNSSGLPNHTSVTDSRNVLQVCRTFQPDILLLDLVMPYHNGFAVMEELGRDFPAHEFLPILVLTADMSVKTKQKALSSGAHDFLSKPLDIVEVVLRIKNLLRTRWLLAELRHSNENLEAKVHERTLQLAEAQVEILVRLEIASEYRDDATGQHTVRVGNLSGMIARALGQSEEQVETLRLAARLHDIGKIGIPDRVLMKPGRLTAEEFEIIKSHTTIGAEILGKSTLGILQEARAIAVSHHEKWDGSGYPQGLQGEQIPLCGRIVAIADVFDALTHDRPYKKAWPLEAALAEINRLSGRHFDPSLVNLFLASVRSEGLQRLGEYLENANYRGISVPALVRRQ